MGLAIFCIEAIPFYKTLGDNVIESSLRVIELHRNVLQQCALETEDRGLCIELAIVKEEENNVEEYLILRQQGEVSESLIAFIESAYHSLFYRLRRLEGSHLLHAADKMRGFLGMDTVAVLKSERYVTSARSYAGYYYYTDIFMDSNGEKTANDNYDYLYQRISLCRRAMISIQLVTTHYLAEEVYAFTNLSADLQHSSHLSTIGNSIMPEVLVDEPLKTYSYYSSRLSKPIFLGNIVVFADREYQSALVSSIQSGLQSNVIGPINVFAVEVNLSNEIRQDYFNYPWSLYHELLYNYRDTNIWNGSDYQPYNLFRLPFFYTVEEASTFFRVPIDDGVIKGFNSQKVGFDNELLSEEVLNDNNIQLGVLANNHLSLTISESDFTRHALIVGTPGSGKTTMAINLLLQFHKKDVPFLIIEPTKTEYRALLDVVDDIQIFTPGKNAISPLVINPFIPPKGIQLEQYIPSLISAFRAAFPMETPLDVIFFHAIRRCYALYKWQSDSTSDSPGVEPFGLFEFILVFKQLIEESGYEDKTKGQVETAGTFRLSSLIDQSKYIYDTVNSVSIEDIVGKPTIIELSSIEDEEQKALLMALLLISICLYTKNRGSNNGKIENILMIDEAHVLLGRMDVGQNQQDKAQEATVRSLQRMIAEIRSFGTGIIIADQKPSKVTSDIVADTDLKIVFRLTEKYERGIIADSINLSEQQCQHLARLKKGEAFVYYSALESAKLIETSDARANNSIRYAVPDREVATHCSFWDDKGLLTIPYYECRACEECMVVGRCNSSVRRTADYYASHTVAIKGATIIDRNALAINVINLDMIIQRYEEETPSGLPFAWVSDCSKIQFLRGILLECNFKLSREERMRLLNKALHRRGYE